jgi:hypothetical protein
MLDTDSWGVIYPHPSAEATLPTTDDISNSRAVSPISSRRKHTQTQLVGLGI